MNPFFIVGSVRSGTTMLRLMLDHHPRISCFGEFEYAVDLLDDPNSWPSGKRYAIWLAHERRFRASNLTVDSYGSYPEIANKMFTEQLARSKKTLTVGGAAVHRHFERLPRLWPDAKFIYLYRDPRDVAKSCVQLGWAGNVWTGRQFWLTAEESWKKLSQNLNSHQRMEVCNEELVRNPVAQLTEVTRFLGEEYSPEMLTYHKTSTYEPPDIKLLDQWKKKLSQREIQLVEAGIQEQIMTRGYILSAYPPLNLGRLDYLKLKLHDKLGKQRYAVQRYGFSLQTSDFLARKLGLSRLAEKLALQKQAIDQQFIK